MAVDWKTLSIAAGVGVAGALVIYTVRRGAPETRMPKMAAESPERLQTTPAGTTISSTCYRSGTGTPCSLLSLGGGDYLRSDAARAFVRMQRAALAEGWQGKTVNLRVESSFRTQKHQQRLWDRYQTEGYPKAATPGYSKHQSGVAVDIVMFPNENKDDWKKRCTRWTSRGSCIAPNRVSYSNNYRWLVANASRFGFRRTVASEPWHWVYTGSGSLFA